MTAPIGEITPVDRISRSSCLPSMIVSRSRQSQIRTRSSTLTRLTGSPPR